MSAMARPTAMDERLVTGARHHHFFPDTEVSGVLPS